MTELVNRAYAVEVFFVDGPRTTADEIAGLIRIGALLVVDRADGQVGGQVDGQVDGRVGGQVRGLAAAVLYRGPGERDGLPPLTPNASLGAYFGMLSVQPELQGRGLGRRLVQVVEAMAAASGAGSMTLRVIDLRDELRRWYTSLGYREVGTTPYTHPSVKRACHFIEMTKALTSGGPRRTGSDGGAA